MLVLVLSIGLLLISGVATFWFGEAGSSKFLAAACGRIGLVMAALWMAWPSLRRPASWLPPGVAIIGVGVLALLAAQPRLIVVAIPAIGTLIVVGSIIRLMKG